MLTLFFFLSNANEMLRTYWMVGLWSMASYYYLVTFIIIVMQK